MIVYFAAFIIFIAAMFGLAIGSVFSARQIKGHCSSASTSEECIKDAFGNKAEQALEV